MAPIGGILSLNINMFAMNLFLLVGGLSPDRLMQVELPIVRTDVCNQPDFYDGVIDDTMLCAGLEEGGVGPCHVSPC